MGAVRDECPARGFLDDRIEINIILLSLWLNVANQQIQFVFSHAVDSFAPGVLYKEGLALCRTIVNDII